jgi:chromate transporter
VAILGPLMPPTDPGLLAELALFFVKAGAFVFGSGLAIVPFLHQGVVVEHAWLTEQQFLDAMAIGLITPGPVVITAAFIGFIVAGLPGAFVGGFGVFLPAYLFVIVPGRWFLRHKEAATLRAFVAGVSAATAGAIVASVILGRGAIQDGATLAIGLVALEALLLIRRG